MYLVADYNIVCWQGSHDSMSFLMFASMFGFVIGIPVISTLILYWNKKLLFPSDDANEEIHRRSKIFENIFGDLYIAYEPSYWYFEGIIMIQKALLTGGLVLVAPGSSAQILVGLVCALVFFTLLLRTQPYESGTEDNLQSIATASTVMTLLIGFALKASSNAVAEENGEYESALMDLILIGLFTSVGLTGMYMTLTALPCFEKGEEEPDDDQEEDKKIIFSEDKKNPESRPSSLIPAPYTTMPSNANTRLQSRIRSSSLAQMRISELTLVHSQHKHDKELQKRISDMRHAKRHVEHTVDTALMHSNQHKIKVQQMGLQSHDRLQKRLNQNKMRHASHARSQSRLNKREIGTSLMDMDDTSSDDDEK